MVQFAFQAAGLDWRQYVRQEAQLFRPVEPHQLIGNAAKAGRLLKWQPEITFEQLIMEMTDAELKAVSQ